MERAVLTLAAALRRADVAVGIDATCDALAALDVVGVTHRAVVRDALATVFVKDQRDRPLFDTLFDRHLPPRAAPDAEHATPPDHDDEPLAPPAAAAAAAADPESPPVDRNGEAESPAGRGGPVAATFDEQVREVLGHLASFDLATTEPGDAEVMRAVRKLGPLLAARSSVRRSRRRHGRVDMRRTIRRSLSTGGVLVDPAIRTRRPHRPNLVVVCDVSGSMGTAARFPLLVSRALRRSFSSVRGFAFVDRMVDVTAALDADDREGGFSHSARAFEAARSSAISDYGAALRSLVTEVAVGPRTVVAIFGDARGNYRPANVTALATVSARSRSVLWLNPEPRAYWGLGDSAALEYEPLVDMAECRTVGELSKALLHRAVA